MSLRRTCETHGADLYYDGIAVLLSGSGTHTEVRLGEG